ncbi:MAG: phosphoenolpyruvate carboxykinase domain-containing protein [Microthrixaceae bacterium]
MLERCDDTAAAVATPIGAVPAPGALDLDGLDLDPAHERELLAVDPDEWHSELERAEQYFATLGDRLPTELLDELDGVAKRLAD